MFWEKEILTTLDVIDRELSRLHKELDSFSNGTHECKEYASIVNQIDKLNTKLVELVTNETK